MISFGWNIGAFMTLTAASLGLLEPPQHAAAGTLRARATTSLTPRQVKTSLPGGTGRFNAPSLPSRRHIAPSEHVHLPALHRLRPLTRSGGRVTVVSGPFGRAGAWFAAAGHQFNRTVLPRSFLDDHYISVKVFPATTPDMFRTLQEAKTRNLSGGGPALYLLRA